MADPYKVLGVAPGASEEEVTQAYRRLAKKYHPDLNPGDKTAEEKMRQVNAAYDQIKTQKTGGTNYQRADGSYGPQQRPGSQGQNGRQTYQGEDPFGGFDFGGFDFGDLFGGGQRSYNDDPPMVRQMKAYLQNGQYQDALRVLSQIPERDGEWYYHSALANAGAGNRVTALNHAKEAVRLQPNNFTYQQLLSQFQRGSFTYRQAGQSHGFDMGRVGRTMMQLLLAQMVCFCCCRPC